MMENKIKHLEMIEAIIERMAKNSFQLKGWSITLISLVSAISAQGSDKRFIILAIIPILGFWFLDSFYLQQERNYKQLYKNVAEKEESEIDFNLDTREIVGTKEEMDRLCFFRCFLSITELGFYLLLAITLCVLIAFLKVF